MKVRARPTMLQRRPRQLHLTALASKIARSSEILALPPGVRQVFIDRERPLPHSRRGRVKVEEVPAVSSTIYCLHRRMVKYLGPIENLTEQKFRKICSWRPRH